MVLYSSQYNTTNIPPEKINTTNEHLNNLIITTDKYMAEIQKQKVIKKHMKKDTQDSN